MIDLLDASVWLPLSAQDHVHYSRARRYWVQEATEQFAFCRITTLALLRHLTNRHVMRDSVRTGTEALDIYERWLASPEVVFLTEPAGLDVELRRLSRATNLVTGLWTDAYLAAFALTGGFRLVTFDSDFSRFPGLTLLRLEP